MQFKYDDGGRSKYFKGQCNDCVVRAIAIAEDKDYREVYDLVNKKLKAYGHKLVRNSGVPKYLVREILKELGYEWQAVMKIGSGCEMHLNEDELPSGDGTIIVKLSGHVACVKGNVLFDTFDCSRNGTRCVYGYWYKV